MNPAPVYNFMWIKKLNRHVKSNTALQHMSRLMGHLVGVAFVALVAVLTYASPSFGQADSRPIAIEFPPEVIELFKRIERAIAEKKYDVATESMQKAIALVSKQLGPNHGVVGALQGQLGRVYDEMGNLEVAITTYRQATEILGRIPRDRYRRNSGR